MLMTDLIHPQMLAALARAGHGATVLLADGHYPASTAVGPNADVVHLNLTPGVLDVPAVLNQLRTAAPWEAATVMVPPSGQALPPAVADYRRQLSPMPVHELERQDFYRAAMSPDLALVVVTADIRTYANLLLTLGVRPFPGPHNSESS